ncbi:UNVERIFIED_CONTAM: hypothetical protein Sradi_3241100 [Sesamum radiatum]|uniref:DUF4283 domain-containing protein n=1 Tax=Sesamum radiatum TaxID=300843 RepID=A0AAW2RH31_SESRA
MAHHAGVPPFESPSPCDSNALCPTHFHSVSGQNASLRFFCGFHGFRSTSPPSVAFPTSDHHHCARHPMANISDRLNSGNGDPPEFLLNPAEFPSLKPSTTESTRPNSVNLKSFSETVAANRRPSSNEHRFFLANSTTLSVGEKTVCDGRPTLVFSDSETASLTKAYRLSLVGKFSQGTPQYRNLHRLIAGLGLRGAFTVGMINAKHVLITLTDEADYSKLWIRRIWFIQGYPMRVFKWSPTFSSAKESSIVPIWVCFPGLPVHLFQKDALSTVASMVGTPLQIDEYTFNQAKLSKARVCIEIDLLQPRIEEIDIQIHGVTIRQKIEYEQLPNYCSLCKHVGHRATECYSKGNAPKPPPRVKKSVVYRQKQHQQTPIPDEHQVFDVLPERNNKSEICDNSSSRYTVETANNFAHKADDTIVAVSEINCIPENEANERENQANVMNGVDEIDDINPSTTVCDNDDNVEHVIVESDDSYPLEIVCASEGNHTNYSVNDAVVGNEMIEVHAENEEKVMNAIVERDAILEDNVGLNGLNVTNVNLSVGAHLSNYFIINSFEKWKKRPKWIKMKEAVQLFKYLKHLGRVCPGARYCKDTFEKGSRFVEAVAKEFFQIFQIFWENLEYLELGLWSGALDWGEPGCMRRGWTGWCVGSALGSCGHGLGGALEGSGLSCSGWAWAGLGGPWAGALGARADGPGMELGRAGPNGLEEVGG